MAEITQNRTVTAKQLKSALQYCLKANRPAMIHGSPGIGKSDVIAGMCREHGGKLYDLRLSQIEQTDLRGMPFYNHETSTMDWAAPVDLPTAEDAAKYPVVFLFLDEINSAAPSIQAAAYQLVLNRKIGTYELPSNVFVVAAGNKESDRGVTYRIPKPLANRLVHFEMRVDFDSWNEWAIENGISADVVGFLNHSKSSLNDFDPKSPEHAFATPRTWEYVSDLIKDEPDEETAMDIIAGTIGEGLALKFMAHRKIASKLPNPYDVITGKVTELKVKDVSAQYSMVTNLLYELRDQKEKLEKEKGGMDKWHEMSDNMLGFILDNLGTEMQVMGMRSGIQQLKLPFSNTKMKNFKRFFEGAGKLVMKSVSL